MTKVYVIDFGRKFFYLQWVDPLTGRKLTRSSQCTKRRDAERKAASIETQLSSDGILADGKTPWTTFLDRYQNQHLASLAERSEFKSVGVLESYGRAMRPHSIGSVTTVELSGYAAALRAAGRAESTIAGHLRTLHAALTWAHGQRMISFVPPMPKIQRAAGARVAKGRPLTSVEVIRMLKATRGVCGVRASSSWRRTIRGLWLSGLRLREACELRWDAGSHPSVDLASTGWLVIPAAFDKAHKDRRLPLTPDFESWLRRFRRDSGKVFQPLGLRGEPVEFFRVSEIISRIGKAANIIVDPASKRTATAHDLRRSFAQRWASKLAPVDLQRLMRHASISTTLAYYLDADSDGLAARLRAGDG